MTDRLFGVVEGFYGKPYTFLQRCDLIKFLSKCGANTYLYGPKSDPYHRQRWAVPYPKRILEQFDRLNDYAEKNGVRFIYALSPAKNPDLNKVIKKIRLMLDIGIKEFAIFFDDINVPLIEEVAMMQTSILNGVYKFLAKRFRHPVLLFCPTQYRGFEETEYIKVISQRLNERIGIFWTGNRVVSKRITKADIIKITRLLKRSPVLWDNIFANDYIPGKILRFPYNGRSKDIVKMTGGILINPMNNYRESKPLLFTAFQFFKNPYGYRPNRAWQIAEKSAVCH